GVWARARGGLLRRVAPPSATPTADELLSSASAAATQHHWLEAAEILDLAVPARAGGAYAYTLRGRCAGELGWIDEMVRDYQTAIRLEPNNPDNYISLATARRSVGDRSGALGALRAAESRLRTTAPREAAARYARPVA